MCVCVGGEGGGGSQVTVNTASQLFFSPKQITKCLDCHHDTGKSEDHWSCIAHLSAEDMLNSAVIEEKKIWLCWGLTSQSTIFQSCRDGAIASWVINQYFRGVKCLAQGHNTAAVGLEPQTSRSGVRHSTTEPPRSPRKEDLKYWIWVIWTKVNEWPWPLVIIKLRVLI